MGFILAYCKDNQQIAHEIDARLSVVGIEFDHLAGDEITGEYGLQAQIKDRTEPVLLLVSDNFLRSTECLYKSLFMLQANEHTAQIQTIVIDGREKKPDGTYQPIRTSFESVSNVIQYMNHWQERYLDLRKLKREATDPDLIASIDAQLKVVRSVSSEVGEFLRVLRGTDFWTYDQFIHNDFELFFSAIEAPELHQQYQQKIKTTKIVIPEFIEEEIAPEDFFNQDQPPSTEVESVPELDLSSMPGVSQSNDIEVQNGIEHPSPEPATIHSEIAPVITSIPQESLDELHDLEQLDIEAETLDAKSSKESYDPEEELMEELGTGEIHSYRVEDKSPLLDKVIEYQKERKNDEKPTANSAPVKKNELDHLIEQIIEEETAISSDLSDKELMDTSILDEIFAEEQKLDQASHQSAIRNNNPISFEFDTVSEEAIKKGKELIEHGQLEEGLELIKTMVDRFPEQIELRFLYANLLANHAEAEGETIDQLEMITEKNPDFVEAYVLLGELAEHRGDFNMAKDYYEKVIELDDTQGDIYYQLGILMEAHFSEHKLLATGYYYKAIKLDSDNTDARFRYSLLVADELDKPKKAIEELEKVVIQNDQHAPAFLKMAQLYYQLGKVKKTAKAYRRAASINPALKTAENDRLYIVSKKETPTFNKKQGKQSARTNRSGAILSEKIPFEINEPKRVSGEEIKTVLITGATSGIGRATAEVFAEQGHRLILTGRRTTRLETIQTIFEQRFNVEMTILPFDVRDPLAVQNAIDQLDDKWKNIDILINNAGLAKGFSPIHEGNIQHWDTMIDTNIKGLLYLTRCLAPHMVERRQGHIINISSSAGKEVYPNGNVYCATKHAVEALTKAMRIELHQYNVRVSQVSPGHVEETEFAFVRFDDKEKAKIYEDYQPLKPRDVAETIYFIASRPPHVNIQDIHLFGTQQANNLFIDRSGR